VIGTSEQSVKVEDVVLVHDDIRRTKWKVEQLVQGADGHVRAANMRYEEGKKTNRPIAKFYPLEVSSSSNKEVTETEVYSHQ